VLAKALIVPLEIGPKPRLFLVAVFPLAAREQVHAEHQPQHEHEGEDDILVGRERGHGRTPSWGDVTPIE
jgi:hypothetical protein